MANFTLNNREETIQRLSTKQFDCIVIGGGITGVGIALDAASRGMSVALVEMNDFASGTSSKSTKLVHGGLRYLKQFEIKEVAVLGREREIVYENGPHITTPEKMLLPFHKGGTFGRTGTSIGLKLYDSLAKVKKSERRKMLSKEEVMNKVPFIKKEGLLGGGLYVEYRTDDARLTIEVAKKAHEYGALLINYCKVEDFVLDNHTISGVKVIDQLTNQSFNILGKVVVNATGPSVDQFRKKVTYDNDKHIQLSKGVHIVIDGSKFPLKQAVYFDTPDNRMVFAIPRDGKTYVGTTDTFYYGDPNHVIATREDQEYLIETIQYMFPELNISFSDIESNWAGVRPLIAEENKKPSDISRKDEIWYSDSGLITIAGGKLTGYRKMAEDIVDVMAKKIGGSFKQCNTKNIRLSGGDFKNSQEFHLYVDNEMKRGKIDGLDAEQQRKILSVYGSNAPKVFKYIESNHTNLPNDIYCQLMYAIDEEMAALPEDFIDRRSSLVLFDIERTIQCKDEIIKVMAEKFNWDEKAVTLYNKNMNELIDNVT